MGERIETVVVGAGQAGLSVSYHLTQADREHVVLERGDEVADTWRTKRWNDFYLNTPKWTQQLPGHVYAGSEPDLFSSLDETISYLTDYADSIPAPVRTGVNVTRVKGAGDEFEVEANDDVLRATNVVVATGAYQRPTATQLAANVPHDVFQLHTSEYQRPEQLPEGAVLVVGSGQSGCQIADELMAAGRRLHLSVGRCPWVPRRYRNRDIVHWLVDIGYMDETVDTLASPAARLVCNPPVSGNDGGHDCNPLWLEERGATLLGRVQEIRGHAVTIAPDLQESLEHGAAILAKLLKRIDEHIAATRMELPEDDRGPARPGRRTSRIEEIDLREAGISTILWSNGYRPDLGWVDVPLFDPHGWPVQERGVTAHAGLYFVGLHWLHKRRSSLLFGVGDDAEHVASHIAGRA